MDSKRFSNFLSPRRRNENPLILSKEEEMRIKKRRVGSKKNDNEVKKERFLKYIGWEFKVTVMKESVIS